MEEQRDSLESLPALDSGDTIGSVMQKGYDRAAWCETCQRWEQHAVRGNRQKCAICQRITTFDVAGEGDVLDATEIG